MHPISFCHFVFTIYFCCQCWSSTEKLCVYIYIVYTLVKRRNQPNVNRFWTRLDFPFEYNLWLAFCIQFIRFNFQFVSHPWIWWIHGKRIRIYIIIRFCHNKCTVWVVSLVLNIVCMNIEHIWYHFKLHTIE